MLNFCTLFDSNFLLYGLAMYRSLEEHCSSFRLYIVTFDDKAYSILHSLELKNVVVIGLSEFEDPALLDIKGSRTKGEYCWTCTSSVIRFCLNKFSLSHCIYIDADLLFYRDPTPVMDELLSAKSDVLITRHNYASKYEQSEAAGIYCVQFMVFKNTEAAREVLEWWRNACIEWCYARFEDGKFGDQKYLDDWPTRFSCVYVSKLLGVGVAPWNAIDFKLQLEDGIPRKLQLIKNRTSHDLFFFHFHGLRLFRNQVTFTEIYSLNSEVIRNIYAPYIAELLKINNFLEERGEEIVLSKGSKRNRNFAITTFLLIRDLIKWSYLFLLKRKKDKITFWFLFDSYHIYKIKNGKLIRP